MDDERVWRLEQENTDLRSMLAAVVAVAGVARMVAGPLPPGIRGVLAAIVAIAGVALTTDELPGMPRARSDAPPG